jgi:hypothetical protein
MAPEQIEAFLNPELWGKVSARADVYSLGLVLRELLTGQMPELPDQKLTPARAMRRVLDRRPLLETNVRRINPRIPHALGAIVTKCLTVSPDDRYRDAHALAQDLERFLSHQPLLHATNPSGRERLTNWGRRHRWVLLSATAMILLGILLRKPIKDQFLPPVESLPVFQNAVGFVDEEKPDDATSALEPLVGDYPDDPLARSYLAFAFDLQRKTTEASAELTRALSTPARIRKLLDWGSGHPKIAVHLESLAESAIKDGDSKLVADVLDEGDEEVYFDAMLKYYEVAKQALDIVERLGRNSLKTQTLIAKVEEFYGDYRGAFDRLSRSLDAAKVESGPLYAPDNSLSAEDLLACHIARCRVAVRWIAPSHKERPFSEPKATLEFLKKVQEEDLKPTENFLKTRERLFIHSGVKEYEVLQNKLRLMLARGEIEIDLGIMPSAGEHLQTARKTMKELGLAAETCRFPAPKMKKTRKRLDAALSRVSTREVDSPVGANSGSHRAKTDSKG